MTTRGLLILVLLFGSPGFGAENTATAENSGPVFAGYANLFGRPVFVIYDPATGESSPWMGLSQVWHGYTFVTFDPKTEKLTLRKDPTDLTLSLKQSKVTEALLRPRLLKGSYAIVGDRIVYSPDAELTFGEGFVMSAANGVMTGNLEQTTIAGNLRVTRVGESSTEMRDAVLDMSGGKMIFHVKGGVTMGPLAPEPPAQGR